MFLKSQVKHVYTEAILNHLVNKENETLFVCYRAKANCPFVGPVTVGRVPSMVVFLKDPRPNLREFRRKPRKTPNG